MAKVFESDDLAAGELSSANTQLAAALSALGIEMKKRPLSMTGDRIQGPGRTVWHFAPKSRCGKFITREMMLAWDDPEFHEKHPEHPLSYMKCQSGNYRTLVRHIKEGVTVAQVMGRGGKLGIISMDLPEVQVGKILQRLER